MSKMYAALTPADQTAAAQISVSSAIYAGWGTVTPAPRPAPAPTSGSSPLDAVAAQLTTGYWAFNGQGARSFSLGADRQVTVDLTALDAETQAVTRAALSAWSDVTGINFVDRADAQITFGNSAPGASSWSSFSGSRIISSQVNIESGWDSDPLSVNSYWMQTYLHEIGHALGLGHSGNYNNSAAWGRDNKFANDSWQVSVMSYFSQTENPNTGGASYAYAATAMAADILAVQALYGTNFQTRGGDTVYGNNSNVEGYLGDLFDQWMGGAAAQTETFINNNITMTLFDTGGMDTLDVSGTWIAQRVDLNAEAKSDVAGLKGNIIIARGTVIENAIGGDGNDTLSGNAAANTLTGNGAADLLDGRGGNDTLFGGDGNDTLIGGAGNDLMFGGTGVDRFDGGSEIDTVSYAASTRSLTVDLATASLNTGDAAGDTLIGIENIVGGFGNDLLRGSTAAEVLRGMDGADQLSGRAGNDTLDGGAGDDILLGGSGADALIGGEGRDRADYSDAAAGVTVSLAAISAAAVLAATAPLVASGSSFSGWGFASAPTAARRGRATTAGTDATGDTFNSIEDVSGSGFNDVLTGNGGANTLSGNAGNDILNGGFGNDVLTGGNGSDTFIFNSGTDTVTDFLDNIDTISIARSLFTTASVTVAQALALAVVDGDTIVFHFNTVDTLVINGLTNINALVDDLVFA